MEVLGLIDIPLWLILGLMTVVLLYFYGSYPMKTWKRLGVPGPDSLPFIGNFYEFYNSNEGIRWSVSKWEKQYGKIIGFQYFRRPCLVITDIDVLKDVLVREYNSCHDRFFASGGKFFPEAFKKGVFFQKGSDWKRIRRIISSNFTSGKLKSLTHHINSASRQLASKVEDQARSGVEMDSKETFGAFSLDVIAGTAFSLKINSQNDVDTQFFKMVKLLFNPKPSTKLGMAFAGLFPFIGNLLVMMKFSIFDVEAVEYFKNYIGGLISERKADTEDSISHDSLQYLVESEMDENADVQGDKKLTNEEVIGQLMSFLLAGYDTTSSTMQFIAYFLARHKDVQEKLLQEIEKVVGQEDEITHDHCQRLTYMECVINETLRLLPTVHCLKRETTKPMTMKGHSIPTGVGIFIPVYNIGRDPELFENPDTFNPDRFYKDEKAVSNISFLSFGFGPKQCIGLRLAIMELKIAIVHVLRKVVFESVSPDVLEFDDFTGILVPKTALKLTLKPRKM